MSTRLVVFMRYNVVKFSFSRRMNECIDKEPLLICDVDDMLDEHLRQSENPPVGASLDQVRMLLIYQGVCNSAF